LIVPPPLCHVPAALAGEAKSWGVTAQLYSLRSARNWGMGDYGDLAALAALAAGRGAAVVGINPLHALFPAEPRHISPYSPSSRLFLNALYLDIAAMPDLADAESARTRIAAPEFAAALAAARDAALIDHVAVAALKQPVLRLVYQSFAARHLAPDGGAGTARGAAFREFQQAGGTELEDFGRFNALHATMWRRGQFSWRDWPGELGDARSREVASFAAAHRAEIDYHHYLEWEGRRQLDAARGGLRVGLYRDLAVGVDPSGADAWAEPRLFCNAAAIGAPPDLLNLKGQDWGLAPLNPVMLRRAAYRPFIAALRANMRHAGMLRIDHAMMLKQLYWVPRGAPPSEGAYVGYPFADLLGILALESARNRCAVIGEDLGTVPPGFSEILNDAGVLSYRLLLFERTEDGGFLPPKAYPRPAAAAFSTHDIATLKGFWL
ncbi:MAG: 4-alpha-glucanotransferase, partial [Stellaceae bacterium]